MMHLTRLTPKYYGKRGYAYSDKGKYIKFINSSPDLSGKQPNAVVTANKISVRKGRAVNYGKLGVFVNGDKITVLDEALNEDYAKVIWQVGYAYSNKGQYIKFQQTPDEANAIVTANKISVRKGRGVNYAKLGVFVNRDKIVVLDDSLNYNYVHVVWQDTEGYAYCDYGKYISYLVPPVQEDDANAIVTANRISVRTGRSVSYTKLGEFKKDDQIVVLDDTLDYDYVHVVWQNTDGYAYCDHGKYIKFTEEEQKDDICCRDMEPNAVVTANAISVREGRGVNYKKLGEFKRGDNIIVGDETLDHEYVLVKWEEGPGYAYCDYGMYISFTDKDICDSIKKTLDIAKTCVGGKYIYGAQGTKITESYVRKRQSRYPQYFTNGRFEFLLDIGRRCDASGTWKFPDDYAWDCSGLWWYTANKAAIYAKTSIRPQIPITTRTVYPLIRVSLPQAMRYSIRTAREE